MAPSLTPSRRLYWRGDDACVELGVLEAVDVGEALLLLCRGVGGQSLMPWVEVGWQRTPSPQRWQPVAE
jgi:hypothetical protein